MRRSTPRVPALTDEELSPEVAEFLAPLRRSSQIRTGDGQADDADPGELLNIFRTLAHHPDLMRRWLVFANHILGKSTLPVRERELVILRIGSLCRSGYEWGQHALISRAAGMTEDEIRSAHSGSSTPGLSEVDRLLFLATEELHADADISDATYGALSKHFSTQQLMDIVFTVGQYNLVSMALNTLGVQADRDLPALGEP